LGLRVWILRFFKREGREGGYASSKSRSQLIIGNPDPDPDIEKA
jgi:hypothetical protein